MKKILLVFVAVLTAVSGEAQETADIGIWGGSSVYFGDMVGTNPLNPLNPNFGAYFRYNFNARVGFRAMFLTGSFSDKGLIEGIPASFGKNVQDISFQAEINYLKYILGLNKTPFTSYVTAGIGVAYFPYEMDPAFISVFNPVHNKGITSIKESVFTPTLPFGIGFKWNIGQRLGLGLEYQMRKLFSDKLDNLDDPLAYEIKNSDGTLNEIITYTDLIHNNDWTGYLGVHITYKIYIGKKPCPAYESK